MSIINSTAIPSGVSDYEIEQSLRFNHVAAHKLSKSFATAGNRKTWTWSGWVKRGYLSSQDNHRQVMMGVKIAANDTQTLEIGWHSDDKFYITTQTAVVTTTQLFRDPSSWYHVFVVCDTTQSSATNRFKLYVNGVDQSLGNLSSVGHNADTAFNQAGLHTIGDGYDDRDLDGYLAEVNFIDGTAKAPSDFGETGTYGEWKPIEYSGSYGTNGFYLPFKQDYTVEGFSAVTWAGNTTDQYIGGVGFNPDLVWIKHRNGAGDHMLMDSIRGVTKNLISNTTAAEETRAEGLQAFNTDGFYLGTNDGNLNRTGRTYVGWNWDMSNPASNVGNTAIQFDNSDDSIDFELGTALGTGNFTIEYWTYIDSLQNFDTFFSTTRGSTGFNVGTDANGKAVWYRGGRILESASGTYVAGNWYHTAYVRNGTTLKVYVNGVEKDSATDSNNYSELTSSIGSLDSGGEFGGIKLDAFRISNVARYTSNNFESPQARFTSDSNTLCLINSPTNVGGTIVDSSSANLSLSLTGTSVDASSLGKPAYPNTDGSITSLVRANTAYGQSIVSYTGNGSDATVGHGLSSAPQLIIIKNRGTTNVWPVYAEPIGNAKRLSLSETNAEEATNNWNSTSPTSSLFTIKGGEQRVNSSSNTYIAYCFHSVSGYSKFGSYTGNASTTGPSVTTGFKPAFLMVKRTDGANSWVMYDNARNPVNVVSKSLKANEADAEEDSSSNDVDFNATSFQVKSTNNDMNASGGTYIYMCFADKREYAYWLDQSGNNNDWTSNNLTESDISVDSPTNNFATWNPLSNDTAGAGTLSEGNLRGVSNQTTDNGHGSTMSAFANGKTYVEAVINVLPSNGYIGICDSSTIFSGAKIYAVAPCYAYRNDGILIYGGGANTPTDIATFAVGDIIQLAIDTSANKLWIGKNNVWQMSGTQNPSTGAGGYAITANIDYTIVHGGDRADKTINFGQDSSFAGARTAQGNQDSNDIGDFYYTPPSGFLALCTSNLPAVAVIPSEHFNTVLYTGNATARSITGVGFQPDWIWIKNRAATENHTIYDVLRGAEIRLGSDYTDGDDDRGSFGLTAFDADGFTIGTGGELNGNTQAIVAWNWKANGSGSSNTVGDINSTVSVNTDAGFSIVSYTANGSATDTVGHGLSQTAEMIFVKKRNGSRSWHVGHKDLPFSSASNSHNGYLNLDATGANNTTNGGRANIPNTTTFQGESANGDTMIAYCFHSVEGYSKVGSYKGNSSADGSFVYLGFRPAFVLIKRLDSSGQGSPIFDSARDEYNMTVKRLKSDSNASELNTDGQLDLLSNGFKLRNTDGSTNNSSGTYLYYAVAETPTKYSNAK